MVRGGAGPGGGLRAKPQKLATCFKIMHKYLVY